ncbi:MAG: lytic murein transglycosylase [Alicyclobacillus sp.]|nr:lytic murein transglycosylase [Alicyclobacillus sp.]
MNRLLHALLAGTGALCLSAAVTPTSNATSASSDTTTPNASAHHVVSSNVQRAARLLHPKIDARREPRQYFPQPCTYIVKPSDTLWEIALVSGVTVSAIKKANGLKSNLIDIGQHLIVPKKWLDYVQRSMRIRPHRIDPDMSPQPKTSERRALMSSAHLADAPVSLIPVYKAAGSRYGIPWTVLAAIHKTETNFGLANSPKSADGAMGPMQFLPSTFAAYAVKAPGQSGSPNIHNVDDAIFTAAHMLAEDGYAQDPAKALFAYNHSDAYVKHIETLAGLR